MYLDQLVTVFCTDRDTKTQGKIVRMNNQGIDIDILGVSRKRIIEALGAEGVTGLADGYANLHLLPMFQQKIAYGSKGFPWTSDICDREVSYDKGICPVAEDLHDNTFMGFDMCLYELDNFEVDLVIKAFKKVWENIKSL